MVRTKDINEVTLTVSEKFYSLQGESVTIGVPAIFIRLQGCNLTCGFCDSKYTWKPGELGPHEKLTVKQLFDFVVDTLPEGMKSFEHVPHIVITGGEPLLQQKAIEAFIKYFDRATPDLPDMSWTFEIETNGTIMPSDFLLARVDHWNCSPKLSNCGDQFIDRFKVDVLQALLNTENVWFKFVVNPDNSDRDLHEIQTDYEPVIGRNRIYLMPEGVQSEDLREKGVKLVEICKQYGYRLTPRLQGLYWGAIPGV